MGKKESCSKDECADTDVSRSEEKRARKLNVAVDEVIKSFAPPDNLTVTEWAEKKRRLSAESAAEPGPWRTSRTPYLKEPMDAFTDPAVRHIVMVAASQVGKSEFINNAIGYIIDEDPGSILFVHPTTIDAKEYSKLRIAPMIRDCPTLRKKVSDPKSRDTGNTILQKTYPGGILTMCGSTEAHALASKPIRYVFGDERDRWALSAGNEGDPWDLAMARQTTFYNAKAVEVSTPTIKNASAIEAAFSTGTMERWKSQCPNCGEYHEIRWADIRYESAEKIAAGKKTYTVTDIYYVCPGCGSVSSEAEMKKQPARWEAQNPEAYKTGTRSFWLNAFVSSWASWESIIRKFLNAYGSTKKMQVVYNTCFGELWEDRGEIEDEDSLMARREEYTAELPEGVLVLTCGVDTQDNRLEYEVVGHGHFGETWGIRKGIIMGRPDEEATWAALDNVIDHIYRFEDEKGLRISMTFVDEGGHFTQDVRLQCRARVSKKVFCIKGMYGPDKPFTAPPKQQKIVINQRAVGTCWQYQIGVDSGKQIIMDNLRVQTPGSKYCHFPKTDEYGTAYFKGLLSEHLVYRANKKQPWVWEKIPGHERNEPLDCRNYAMAAFKALPVNLDEIDRHLKAARNESLPPSISVKALNSHKSTSRKKGSAANKYYDNW
ncbi:MAG: phage terminase large subunit family protein [Clostridia bacterium]|nr:phage terminase large subunit family protein [Clostridia bacterium]